MMVYGQSDSESLLKKLHSDQDVTAILNDSIYQVQIIYTTFDSLGLAETYDLSDERYYYPASVVKLPVAFAVLEQMTELGLSLDDRLIFEENVHCGNRDFVHDSQRNKLTFRHLLREMIVVSDNKAYNALYHFVTPGHLNKRLWELGFSESKIFRSFSGCDFEGHLHTNACHIKRSDSTIYSQPECVLDIDSVRRLYEYEDSRLFGSRHEDRSGNIVSGPYDFNYHLEIPLRELHDMMMRFFEYRMYSPSMVWQIDEIKRGFMEEILMEFPSETGVKKYQDKQKYPDNLYKYAIHGEEVNDSIQVYSKLGLSHGFTTETAYIVAGEKRYYLTVSMYTNQNDVVNDGKYEYETIARPFIAKLSYLLLDQ